MASNKYTWAPEEDQALIDLIDQNGEKKWCKIANLINEQFKDSDKTGKQCRERWYNHLNPNLNKESFTLEDEIKVFEYQKQFGNKWSEIASHFPGRNDNFIKNCFYSAIRRNIRKYNRKKVPSKQLKGTISSLLKNIHTRKIIMNFPEHENPEPQKIKPEIRKEEQIVVEKIKDDRFVKPEVRDFPIKNEQMIPSVHMPTRLENIHRPSPLSMGIFRGIDDITPRLTATMSFGLMPDDYETLPELVPRNISIDLCRNDSVKTDNSTTYKYILPDYSPSNSFQHYFSPRNSK
ncbi:hypothetical protein SteCoe_27738 [Stentor coeruleus]|uniref:Myb-like DNA-binding domain containing protein n=1 Tax=Stentor coeruleus TaxID=5963 RepID=A0A1R2BA29_9CILI|nr:hypothetical protein SteCoe_27738 [Stentor coeruleus]